MTAHTTSKAGSFPMARALVVFAIIALAGPVTGKHLSAQAPAPTPAPTPEAPKRNIAGPGDYALRETIVRLIGRDPDFGREKITIILVNGGAVFSGEIKNCALKKNALTTAALTRGVI